MICQRYGCFLDGECFPWGDLMLCKKHYEKALARKAEHQTTVVHPVVAAPIEPELPAWVKERRAKIAADANDVMRSLCKHYQE